MEKISVRALAQLFLCSVLLFPAISACQKRTETGVPSSPAPSDASGLPASALAPAAPITGPITPAMVSQEANSLTKYLHFPRDPTTAKLDSAVQFYCDVTADGTVETTQWLVGNNDAFKAAVQSALDWGRFTPATVNQKPTPVYLAGTILFFHEEGAPVIVVSLATHERERVGKMANYIQPQLIGGLRRTVERALRNLAKGVLVSGRAEVLVNVDARGAVTGTSVISQTPMGSGLGELLNGALKSAQFTPAYENGSPAAGGINVVADFGQL
jgi:hypothetical protein